MSATSTPLFTACVYGLQQVLHITTQADNFNVNAKNLIGHSGIYLAAAFGNHEIVQTLLDLGADIHVVCGKYGSALAAGAAGDYRTVVRLLLSNSTIIHSQETLESALEVSFLTGHEDIARLLLDNGFQVACQGSYDKVLTAASKAGFYHLVQHLAQILPTFSKKNNNRSGSKLIEAAIRQGQLPFVKKYVAKGWQADHPVATAALFGQSDIVSLFIDEGFYIEDEGPFGTPLRTACLMGHQTAAEILLDRGCEVNACGYLGDALQAAAMIGHLSIVNLLIKHRANINIEGGYYGTALQAAAYRGHRNVVSTLIDAGARITAHGRYKDAFHAAAEAGQEGIVSLILDRGYQYPRKRGSTNAYCPPLNRNLLERALQDKTESAQSTETHKKDSEMYPYSRFGELYKVASEGQISEPQPQELPYRSQRSISLNLGKHEEDESYALEVSAARGHTMIVQRILDNCEQLGVEDYHAGRALWVATMNGHSSVIGTILRAEMDLRSYIAGALGRASWRGHPGILDSLLAYEARWRRASERAFKRLELHDSEEKFPEGSFRERNDHVKLTHPHALRTVFFGCLGDQPFSVIYGLQLVESTEVQQLREIALEIAAEVDGMGVMNFLFQNAQQFEPEAFARAFQAASRFGSKSALIHLVKQDSRKCLTTEHFKQGMKSAITEGQVDVVEYLFQYAAAKLEATESFTKLFVHATHKGYLPVLKLLSSELINHERRDETQVALDQALSEACTAGHIDVVEHLLHEGAAVNAATDEKRKLPREIDCGLQAFLRDQLVSPERNSSRTSLQACLQRIPEYGDERQGEEAVREFRQDKDHIRARQEPIAKLLLEHGADVNLTVDSKITPFHSAVLNGTEKMDRLMIEHNADIHSGTPGKNAALQCASRREVGSLPIVHLFLEAGAKVPIDYEAQECSSPILRAVLCLFGTKSPEDAENREENGRFMESDTLGEVMTAGAGAVIKLLLQIRPELQARDERFSLVLQMAAAVGDVDFVRLLIDRKVDVNLPGHYFGTSLQAAARFGHIGCLRKLLSAGAEVNLVQGYYGTPLQAAVRAGHLDIARTLVSHGADVNLRLLCPSYPNDQIASISAIQIAVESQNVPIAACLLNAGAQIDTGSPVLDLAVKNNDFDMARILLNAGADVNHSDQTPILITACRYGSVDLVKFLLDRGADLDITGSNASSKQSSLHQACYRGRNDIVRVLLKRGADPDRWCNDESVTPLAIAARKGDLEIMEQLLGAGASTYYPSDTLDVLSDACKGTKPEPTIEFLLQYMSDPTIRRKACEEALLVVRQFDDPTFMLPLEQLPECPATLARVCISGCRAGVQSIIGNGVDVNSDFKNGGRAVHLAAYYQRPHLLPILIQRGADVNHKSSKYATPLSAALEGALASRRTIWEGDPVTRPLREMLPHIHAFEVLSHLDAKLSIALQKRAVCEGIVQTLLHAGAWANPESGPLGPPLHLASYIGSLPCVELLLRGGADINTGGGYFGSALLAAIIGKHQKVAVFLLEQGIDVNICSPRFGTALHYACGHNKSRFLILTLLENGADVNASASKNESPLTFMLAYANDTSLRREMDLNESIDLLFQYGTPLRVSTDDLRLAVAIPSYQLGEDTLKRLLEHDENAEVTEDVIVAAVAVAAGSFSSGGALKTILRCAPGVQITPDVIKAVEGCGDLLLLLHHEPRCHITNDILQAVAGKRRQGEILLKTFLEHDLSIQPTPSVVMAFLQHCRSSFRSGVGQNTLRCLLDRNPQIQITEDMLAASRSSEQLTFLLSRGTHVRITQELLEKFVSHLYLTSDLLEALLQRGKLLEISNGVLMGCLNGSAVPCLRLLLERDPELVISEEFILKALSPGFRGRTEKVIELFLEYGKNVVFTPAIRKAINERRPRKSEEALKSRILDLEETSKTPSI